MCKYGNIKSTLCPRTCKACEGSEDVLRESENLTCRDERGEHNCRAWRDLGYCDRDNIRNQACRKTCAECGEGKFLGFFAV
jgi:hypothetical protein